MASIEDIPNDLAVAFAHAAQVIRWEQTLDKGEMPPEWMWPFPDDLNLWFEDVQAARDERASPNSDAGDDGDMVENDLAPRRPRSRR